MIFSGLFVFLYRYRYKFFICQKMYKELPVEIQSAINNDEALIISLSHLPRNSKQSARVRNKYIINIADKVVFGALDTSSSLANLTKDAEGIGSCTISKRNNQS